MTADTGEEDRPHRPPGVPPLDDLNALTTEPPVFGERRASALSPHGEVQMTGDFLRGLGPRRAKVLVFGTGVVVLTLTLLAAL